MAYINTYTYNHQSYKAFKVGFYLRSLLFVCSDMVKVNKQSVIRILTPKKT